MAFVGLPEAQAGGWYGLLWAHLHTGLGRQQRTPRACQEVGHQWGPTGQVHQRERLHGLLRVLPRGGDLDQTIRSSGRVSLCLQREPMGRLRGCQVVDSQNELAQTAGLWRRNDLGARPGRLSGRLWRKERPV